MVPIVSCCSPSVHKAKPHYSHYNEGPMKEMSSGGDWEVNAAATLHRAFREKDRRRSEVCKKNKGSEVCMGGSKLPKFLSPTPKLLLLWLSSFVFRPLNM